MKGYVILALLMLAPTMAYFQKLHFEENLKGDLEEQVIEVLEDAGVEGANAAMDWMDVTIEGRVRSVARRVEVGTLVDAIEGVRLSEGGNQLRADGWLRLTRQGRSILATGLLPEGYVLGIPDDAGRVKDQVIESQHVVTPDPVYEWSEFLARYFGEVGDRAVELKDGRLTLSGSATPGLRSDWLSKASGVVGREHVSHEFELFASVYHLPGYEPQSTLGSEAWEQLRTRLAEAVVFFETGERVVPDAETIKISSLAKAILALGPEETYLIGILATREANSVEEMELRADRIIAIMRQLISYGVQYEQFEVVDFSSIREGDRDDGVEILLK